MTTATALTAVGLTHFLVVYADPTVVATSLKVLSVTGGRRRLPIRSEELGVGTCTLVDQKCSVSIAMFLTESRFAVSGINLFDSSIYLKGLESTAEPQENQSIFVKEE